MEEYLDIWDENGQPTGNVLLKTVAHKQGLFHPTVHVWFYTPNKKILMQQRGANKETFPSLWDVSVAGHVGAGETIIEGALREVKEEIGILISKEDLTQIDVRKNINIHPNGIHDCEFQHVFLVELKHDISQLTIQEEEVDGIRLFTFNEIALCMTKSHKTYSIVPADMNYYQFIMNTINSIL